MHFASARKASTAVPTQSVWMQLVHSTAALAHKAGQPAYALRGCSFLLIRDLVERRTGSRSAHLPPAGDAVGRAGGTTDRADGQSYETNEAGVATGGVQPCAEGARLDAPLLHGQLTHADWLRRMADATALVFCEGTTDELEPSRACSSDAWGRRSALRSSARLLAVMDSWWQTVSHAQLVGGAVQRCMRFGEYLELYRTILHVLRPEACPP